MIAFLFVLAVSARDDFSKLHKLHLEDYFQPSGNAKFKALSVKYANMKLKNEYAKLNDDAVIARNKDTNEIEVFATYQNEPLSFFPPQDYDLKLIQDFTSRCVPLHKYEFAGDFDRRTGGHGYKPTASSYMVAMNRETKQTFGDSINIIHFKNHQWYVRLHKEYPVEYQREKEEYIQYYDWNEEDFERQMIYLYLNPPRLYRQKCDHGHEIDECILKFSKLSQDPQDLLQKCMDNGFQDKFERVELKNIEAMLIQNGYKYPENFILLSRPDFEKEIAKLDFNKIIFSSEFSKIDPHSYDLKDCLN